MKQACTHRGLLLGALVAALALVAFPVAAQAGTLVPSPPSSNYNTQPYFFGSQFNSFQVSNSVSDTSVGNADIIGPDAARFSFSGDACSGLTLTNTHSCHIEVVFNPPNGPGSFIAQLRIPSDGSPNPLVIPLSAQVLAGPDLVSGPGRIDFGITTLGTAQSRQVTIANVGDFAGGVQQAFVVGPAEFKIADDQCSQQQINPGQSCTLTAMFIPSSAYDYQGSIFAIAGNSSEPVLPINLSGQGRLAPGPAPATRIKRKPANRTRSNTASFQFTSPEAGVSFECKLDKEAFAPCTSPSTYVVKRGRHSFQVRARDAAGTVDATPAKDYWKVTKKKK
ncbi:MAG: choice-of-anchor D domain-containing protein [Solirubrobacterales bacterium]